MHDVKQGARTFVRRQLVDKDDNIQKCTSQRAQEHRQLDDQNRKNRKLTGQRTHERHQRHAKDCKIVGSNSLKRGMKSLRRLQGHSRGPQGPMHDVKQGARTLVCHQIVDRYGKIQKFASQGTQEHRQLVDQDRKNRKYLFKGTHGRRQLHDEDSKVVSLSSMQHRIKSLKRLQGRSR